MESQENVNNAPSLKEEEYSLKLIGQGDRLKRDEWSEGAVACLLDAYESKWILRNRAKLKGNDWEDVARQVSSRANSTKSSKTSTQCKNKIESMKKRYRSESASGSGSRWPLFPRLDGLVRCRAPPTTLLSCPPLATATQTSQSPEPNGIATTAAQGEERIEGGCRTQPNEMDKEADHDTPSLDSYEERQKIKKEKKKRKEREEGEEWAVMGSIQWLAEVVLKVEQARMETMREVEKIRAQAEAKKGEMDLKRTEIIANTQLQIAKLLVRSNDNVDSSPRVKRD